MSEADNTRVSSTKARNSSDNIPLAVAVILVTVLALSLGDALIKLTSGNFVIWQIFVLRSVIAIPVLLAFMCTVARGALTMPGAVRWTVLRSVLLVVMWISYYISLPYLPLSAAAAAYYTLPIFITLFSALLTGDRISLTGWLPVFAGFGGVLLILRPGAEDFNAYALLPVLSAILYALAMILTRTRCRNEHPLLLSLALNISFVVTGILAAFLLMFLPDETRHGFLLAPWVEMNPSRWMSMGLLATALLIGSIGAAIAYQKGPSSIIGVFDFAYVGFAVLWGAVFFAEVPDVLSVAGIALIVVAGIVSIKNS